MISVGLYKIVESDNIIFYGVLYNKERDNYYEYCCAQTKDGLTTDQCMQKIWYEADKIARFFGIGHRDIKIQGLSDREKLLIVKQLTEVDLLRGVK